MSKTTIVFLLLTALATLATAATVTDLTVGHAGEPGKRPVFGIGDTIAVAAAVADADGKLTVRWTDTYQRVVAERTVAGNLYKSG